MGTPVGVRARSWGVQLRFGREGAYCSACMRARQTTMALEGICAHSVIRILSFGHGVGPAASHPSARSMTQRFGGAVTAPRRRAPRGWPGLPRRLYQPDVAFLPKAHRASITKTCRPIHSRAALPVRGIRRRPSRLLLGWRNPQSTVASSFAGKNGGYRASSHSANFLALYSSA
jgi:hypothetical protein